MALLKPYKRIYRPCVNKYRDEYVVDRIYSPDRLSFIHSYHLIEKDLKELFDYISPNDSNKHTFSHRIYELFFRCCTEFENNSKAILNANNYVSNSQYMNIANDYFKLNTALKLNEYKVRLNIWENGPKILQPFSAWNSQHFSALIWYQDYNAVKHNRTQNFSKANLENLVTATAGLLVILYAQYAYHAFSPYQSINLVSDNGEYESGMEGLFEIKPCVWNDAEKYDFDWSTLIATQQPCQSFIF